MFSGDGLAFPAVCTLGFDQGGGVAVADAAENIHNAFVAELLPLLTDDVILDATEVKYGPNDTGPSALHSDPQAGSETGTGSPSNTAYLIQKNTALGGRQGRGRMFLPGVLEDGVGSDGAILLGRVDLINDGLEAFAIVLALQSLAVVLLHSDALAPTPVISLTCSTTAGTQRRRMRR